GTKTGRRARRLGLGRRRAVPRRRAFYRSARYGADALLDVPHRRTGVGGRPASAKERASGWRHRDRQPGAGDRPAGRLQPCHAARQHHRNERRGAGAAGRLVPRGIGPMTRLLLRGRVLSFLDEPQSLDDTSSYAYFEDGEVEIADGRVVSIGPFDGAQDAGTRIIDHRPHLIMAGFIDPHIHFPQMQVIGSYAAALLEWLNTYTFVEEQKFGDARHCARIASRFFDELIRHGTTTAAAYCSVH